MNDRVVLGDLTAILARRQLPAGGWPALRSSSQSALEPTCFSALAFGPRSAEASRTRDFIVRTQNPNGSWPVFVGDDQNGAWVTSLAVIALRDIAQAIPARLKGFHWLLSSAGKESNWFWKWKFRTADRHVRFDPGKFGWPWVPDTASWVVPTAYAILALNQSPCSCGGFESAPSRAALGVQMLLDRACPGGGWNAGNGVVYGSPVAPHADDTAIALLALSNRKGDPVVQGAVHWLEQTAPTLTAPWSLAWALLALAAHDQPIGSLVTLLANLPDLANVEDNSTLALVCLALDCRRSLNALGVTA